MCGVPLPWWTEELDKDKEQQEQNIPPTTPAEESEKCD